MALSPRACRTSHTPSSAQENSHRPSRARGSSPCIAALPAARRSAASATAAAPARLGGMPTAGAAAAFAQPACQVLIKLGGAALTHKEQLETLNGETLAAAAAQLAALYAHIGARFIVVHGAGE